MFDKSGVSVAAAWHGIMDFAIHHHLPYSAIQNLLNLFSFISPENNHLLKTLHLLKKQYKLEVPEKKYCSHCLQIVPVNEAKCSKVVCRKLVLIFVGMYMYLLLNRLKYYLKVTYVA